MVERLTPEEISKIQVSGKRYNTGIGFLASSCTGFNCYKNPSDWYSTSFDEILKSINENIMYV